MLPGNALCWQRTLHAATLATAAFVTPAARSRGLKRFIAARLIAARGLEQATQKNLLGMGLMNRVLDYPSAAPRHSHHGPRLAF